MTCKRHPEYDGVEEPRDDCGTCIVIWAEREALKYKDGFEDQFRSKKLGAVVENP